MRKPPKEAVVVVGSGPIRIGQGIEFDYSSVHAAWALREAGRSPVVVNNNPETVSTDFDISDVLVFEPPGADEVEAAYKASGARGVMLAFGGQTAINLAEELHARGVPIIGSDRRSLDMAEDREKFDAALTRLGVARPKGRAAKTFREARVIARELGFPVIVRPSYVLGGRGMEIVYNEGQLASYVESAAADARRAAAGRQVSARPRGRGRRGLRRRGHPHSGNLRARRARRHPFRRFDQRLSAANDRCRQMERRSRTSRSRSRASSASAA